MEAISDSEPAITNLIQTQERCNRLAASETAMSAVAASETAMSAVAASETAMISIMSDEQSSEMFFGSDYRVGLGLAAYAGINNSDLKSCDTISSVAASSTAMQAVAASSTAMQAVAASSTAVYAIEGSTTALSALASSPLLIDQTVNAGGTAVSVHSGYCFIVSVKPGYNATWRITGGISASDKDVSGTSVVTVNMFFNNPTFARISGSSSYSHEFKIIKL